MTCFEMLRSAAWYKFTSVSGLFATSVIGAANTSETSVNVPEHLHTRRREYLKSQLHPELHSCLRKME